MQIFFLVEIMRVDPDIFGVSGESRKSCAYNYLDIVLVIQ